MASQNLVGDDSGTQSGQQDNSTTAAKKTAEAANNKLPGRRLENPLSKFASYTYNLALYMISPSAYDTFAKIGRKNISQISSGLFLVAQSGGIDDKSTVRRTPGFEFDFYIDNLRITTTTSAKSTMMDSNTTSLDFVIIEPNSFSFINKLTKASQELLSNVPGTEYRAVAARQFFILEIKFTGYDADGNQIKQTDIDPTYYDLYITGIKFKIDGKSTVYNIKAATLQPGRNLGNKHGRINFPMELIGVDVKTILAGGGVSLSGESIGSDAASPYSLIACLNDYERKLAKDNPGLIPMEYDLKFVGDGVEALERAKIMLPNDWTDKLSWVTKVPGLLERTTNAMNSVTTLKDTQYNVARLSVNNGTTILQVISNVISRSSYLVDALKVVFDSTTSNYSNSTSNTQDEYGKPIEPNPDTKPIRWYNVSTQLSNAKWDPIRKDFAYKITYIIEPYDTPNVLSSFVGLTSRYYGPHKRYEYWFTGKNTEIMSYEQNLDNTFYLADYKPGTSQKTFGNPTVPTVPGQMQDVDRTTSLGIGLQAQAGYLTNLYSPGDWVNAKIRILGDPDFLVQDSPTSVNQVYSQFYGSNGLTVKANGGQVFIEINFNEAIDYDYEENDGLMSLNDNILFWAYPPEVRERVKGNSYQVIGVSSEFNRGSFVQTLDCVINHLKPLIDEINQKKNGTGNVGRTTAQEVPRVIPQDVTPTEYYGDITTSISPDDLRTIGSATSRVEFIRDPDAGREAARAVNRNIIPGSGV